MRKHLNKNKLLQIISKLHKPRILVVGDIILDHYIWGKAERLSPEAPVPVVWANRENFLLGGASNVAWNLSKLGVKTHLSGIIGTDFYGKLLAGILAKEKIDKNCTITSKQRPTTLKARVIAQHQQVVRIDWESNEEISINTNQRLLKSIKKSIDEFDAVILEDYGKGVINPDLLDTVIPLCKDKNKIITVDPKESHFDLYKDVTALTPNLKEASSAANNMKIKTQDEINLLGKVLLSDLSPQALLLTLGEDGMRLFQKEGSIFHLPTFALEVFDVSGAGDTVIAVFTAALSAGASFLEASFLANMAASIVVEKIGVYAVTKNELKERVDKYFNKVKVKRAG